MSQDLRQFREGSSKSATNKRLDCGIKPFGSTLVKRVLKFSRRPLETRKSETRSFWRDVTRIAPAPDSL
jgi:hypothetical protein